MCIRLNSIEESPKVAESDMTTYKILEVLKDKKTGEESYYSPFSTRKRLQYNVGKLYTETLGKKEEVQYLYGGMEGYYCSAKTTTGLYSYRDLDTAVQFMHVLENSFIATKCKIFQCSIPKGSKYYTPEHGSEIVSDNLEIVNQVSLLCALDLIALKNVPRW